MVEDAADQVQPTEHEVVEGGKVDRTDDGSARSFVDQFTRHAGEPLRHGGYASSPANFIEGQRFADPNALWNIVHELNATRGIVEPRTYDELQSDPQALEAYIEDAATRQSVFREQAVSARIEARVKSPPESPFRPLFEEEADLHDAVAAEAGRGAVTHYRQLESGTPQQPDEQLRQYFEDVYVEAGGFQQRLEEAQAAVDAGKEPKASHEQNLLFFKTLIARERDRARSDFSGVYGSETGVEALIRRKTVLESDAWLQRTKATEKVVDPGKMFGRSRIVAQARESAGQAKTEAYRRGDAAVTKFRDFQATRTTSQ